MLQGQVDRLLLLQDAKARGITIPDAEVEQRVARLRADWPTAGVRFPPRPAAADRSTSSGPTRWPSSPQERLFHDVVYPRVAVTEEQIRADVEAHPERSQEPEQVHAAQIVVKELDQAKEIRAQLRNGAKFADLARERSLSADAKDGGDLGWFRRGVMPEAFDQVAFSLGAGQISEVVPTDYGFHIFKVLEKRPARKKDLAQVRAEVEQRLLRAKQEQAQTDFVAQLRSRASIRINEPLVAQVMPRPLSGSPQETAR